MRQQTSLRPINRGRATFAVQLRNLSFPSGLLSFACFSCLSTHSLLGPNMKLLKCVIAFSFLFQLTYAANVPGRSAGGKNAFIGDCFLRYQTKCNLLTTDYLQFALPFNIKYFVMVAIVHPTPSCPIHGLSTHQTTLPSQHLHGLTSHSTITS